MNFSFCVCRSILTLPLARVHLPPAMQAPYSSSSVKAADESRMLFIATHLYQTLVPENDEDEDHQEDTQGEIEERPAVIPAALC